MFGVLRKGATRKIAQAPSLFEDGVIGGYYPIIPGLNLWQDASRTVPATAVTHKVRVIDPVAGTLGSAIAASDAARAEIVSDGGRYLLQYTGVEGYSISNVPTQSGYSYYARYKTAANGTDFRGVLLSDNAGSTSGVLLVTNFASENSMLALLRGGSAATLTVSASTQHNSGLIVVSSSTWTARHDGVDAGTRAHTTSGTDSLGIGLGDGGAGWVGLIGDVAVINRTDVAAIAVLDTL